MHVYLHKNMDDRIVSTAVLTLSRQQEEFLARYRTHEAQKAYFESYGLGVTPFFRGGGGSHGVIPPSPEPVLPYDYEVEYLEVNSETGFVFIDTKFILDSFFSLEALFNIQSFSSGSYNVLFSNGDGLSAVSYGIYRNGSSDADFCIKWNSNYSGQDVSLTAPFNIPLFIEIDGVSKTVTFNNITKGITNISSMHNSSSLKLFSPVNSRIVYAKFYYMKINNGDIPVLHLIPVVKDSIGCVYDKVSGKILEPQGGGRFTLGKKI